jgi:Spy/CpxP family protein refolding chaperone
MKRPLGLLIFALSFGLISFAQTTDTTGGLPKKPDPTKQAVRQLKMLQQQLNLTEDQVTQMQVILIHRDVVLDSIRQSTAGGNGDRRSNGRARREINQDADQKINALLTADQKPLYQQWKQQQREKLMEKRQMNGQPQPAP